MYRTGTPCAQQADSSIDKSIHGLSLCRRTSSRKASAASGSRLYGVFVALATKRAQAVAMLRAAVTCSTDVAALVLKQAAGRSFGVRWPSGVICNPVLRDRNVFSSTIPDLLSKAVSIQSGSTSFNDRQATPIPASSERSSRSSFAALSAIGFSAATSHGRISDTNSMPYCEGHMMNMHSNCFYLLNPRILQLHRMHSCRHARLYRSRARRSEIA